MDTNIVMIIATVLAIISFTIGYFFRAKTSVGVLDKAKADADEIINLSQVDVQKTRGENYEKASAEIARRRIDFESEDKEQRSIVQINEKRLQKKSEVLAQKQEQISERELSLTQVNQSMASVREAIDAIIVDKRRVLEEIAAMTTEQAKATLIDRTVQETRQDCNLMIKKAENDIKDNSQKTASDVIATAIQRCSGGHVDEPDTPPVVLVSEEARNRLFGRDGKNLKVLQTLTGVEWSVDPDRNTLVFTSPDSVKREIARAVAGRLLTETRVHPHKIQDVYDKVRKEINVLISEEGHRAIAAADVKGLHPELLKLLGRLQFRTSYGQNVLTHSVEVARLAGAMAAELGADTTLARRAGLLHDIGKALDHEMEGSHVIIGVDVASKYNESPEVIHCIAAHHGDEEFNSIEASLVSSADTLSAGRPGARRETLESYIKRVEALESMASSFDGVDKAYAIHAGREVRVLVKPDRVTDEGADKLSELVARKLESELEYPGQIRVVVVRETRVVDYAK